MHPHRLDINEFIGVHNGGRRRFETISSVLYGLRNNPQPQGYQEIPVEIFFVVLWEGAFSLAQLDIGSLHLLHVELPMRMIIP